MEFRGEDRDSVGLFLRDSRFPATLTPNGEEGEEEAAARM